MAELYDIMKEQSKYWDKKNYPSLEAYNAALETSATVYVGNLSFYTQQNAIKELFSRAGNVKNIIMGIDNDGNPCGFCFVIYETKREAELAVQYISKTRLGGRIIRVDLDPGYMEGRQKGRGTSGQQRREDYRLKQDPERPRKKVITGSGGREPYRDRGDSYRGGYKDRGQGGYRGNRDDNNQRDQHRGERRDYRYRDNRGGNNYGGQQRGERRDYRENREQRQPREYRPGQQPQPQPQQGTGNNTNNNNPQADY